jgi:hypothetical protein
MALPRIPDAQSEGNDGGVERCTCCGHPVPSSTLGFEILLLVDPFLLLDWLNLLLDTYSL